MNERGDATETWKENFCRAAGANITAKISKGEKVLGGGLEPPCLTAYAPQTYVSAISPPEPLLRWAVIPTMVLAGCKRVFSTFCALENFSFLLQD